MSRVGPWLAYLRKFVVAVLAAVAGGAIALPTNLPQPWASLVPAALAVLGTVLTPNGPRPVPPSPPSPAVPPVGGPPV